jgi:hypothetical protein
LPMGFMRCSSLLWFRNNPHPSTNSQLNNFESGRLRRCRA